MSQNKFILIIGTGPAGLGAADRAKALGFNYLVLERQSSLFGRCKSFEFEGEKIDQGPHLSFTKSEIVKNVWRESCPNLIEIVNPIMLNHWEGEIIPHPVQSYLAYIPEGKRLDIVESIKCRPNIKTPKNYNEWLLKQFGYLFNEEFTKKYTKKYWTVYPDEMTVDWVGKRVAAPPLEKILESAKSKDNCSTDHYFNSFRYPDKGGYEKFLHKSAQQHKDKIRKEAEVISINLESNYIVLKDGEKISFDHLVSTIPLDQIPSLLEKKNVNLIQAADKLNCSSVSLYTIAFRRHKGLDGHWGYVYDLDIPFARYYFPKTLVNDFESELQFVQMEVYFSKSSPKDDRYDNLDNVIYGLEKLNILKKQNVINTNVKVLKYANVIFDHSRDFHRSVIIDFLKNFKIASVGRYGSWRYLWSDQSYLDGRSAIDRIYNM